MILLLTYLIGALALSFLCSVLEAVLLSTPMSFITMKETECVKGASRLKQYKTNIDRPIAAILSLNTIAHTVGAAGVGAEATKIFGEASFGIISAVLTLLILVLSEIIPKTIGASYWRRLAIPAGMMIHVLVIITYPLVWLSEYITRFFSSNDKYLSVSREEVSAIVSVASEEGVLNEPESRIMQNTIRLSNIRTEEIMTPNLMVVSVPEKMTVKEFFNNMELSYSRILVYKENKDYITGYVLKSTILELLAKDRFDIKMEEIKRPVLRFDDGDCVLAVWEKLLATKEHISVITDNYGCLRGIVTMEDIIETMLGEEIVDEADTEIDLQQAALDKFKAMEADGI